MVLNKSLTGTIAVVALVVLLWVVPSVGSQGRVIGSDARHPDRAFLAGGSAGDRALQAADAITVRAVAGL